MLVQGRRGGWQVLVEDFRGRLRTAGDGWGRPGMVEDGRGLSKAASNGEGRRSTVANSGCERNDLSLGF